MDIIQYHGTEHFVLREEGSSTRQLIRVVPITVPEDEQEIRAFWITRAQLDRSKTTPRKSKETSVSLPDSVTNEDRVYTFLLSFPLGMLADEGVECMEQEDGDGRPKVNQVAPILSAFKRFGIVRWSGTRETRSGGTAHVNILVENSEAAFFSAYGRGPLEAKNGN